MHRISRTSTQFTSTQPEFVRPTIPFPKLAHAKRGIKDVPKRADAFHDQSTDTDEVLAAFSNVSRRINDLARELKCLGYFEDEDNDRPRAA